ncbi:hypothetical protein ACFVWF_29840 [Rhodococcus qingshengii]|uniref:hypothetical protein n=1 Tax=Rhodococcus qingshengii TaxID=334542 RepID=UPI0036DF530D
MATRRAASLVLVFTAATAITVAVTRTYLVLADYPSLGGEVFHLAHALWGGLFLVLSLVLILAVGNSWSAPIGSAIGGVGAGLFVDEVGKFITRKNDYLFPLAATIIYAFLVSLAAVTLYLVRRTRDSARSHAHAALELFHRAFDGTITDAQVHDLRLHLAQAKEYVAEPKPSSLLEALERAVPFVEVNQRPVGAWNRRLRSVGQFIGKTLTPSVTRRIVLILLIFHAIAGTLLLGSQILNHDVFPNAVNGVGIGPLARALTDLSVVAWCAASILALAAAFVSMRKPENARLVARLGTISMLCLLTVGNSLAAYVDQFAVLADAVLQVTTLAAIVRYSRFYAESD